MPPKISKKKNFILLRGIVDTTQIHATYKLDKKLPTVPNNSTKITEITQEDTEIYSFFDDAKMTKTCIISMYDPILKRFLSNNFTIRPNCFWCRHAIKSRPMGCPVNYVSNIPTDYTYNTDFSGDPVLTAPTSYYEVDGMFCSFNCIISFINDNCKIPLYDNSKFLLSKIYFQMFGKTSKTILPAPSWRLLTLYGGSKSIEEFRDGFNTVEYTQLDTIKRPFPPLRFIGMMYEEKYKL
jgi:hypothetical protein